ncbi:MULTISPECIES: phosphate/phosphite/phosphonate ABC transporter substrate-binding protein [Fischerella]|uniref:Phosphate/phosphite/phosphonate ABC transporter substrate-binding protein n=1 Tax=Fischerella muscicola CCMEE 5323 TaxID=2019572 RepID=A0A2N6K8L8_FISMU|nr:MULTISPECIES: phosphate/phosphite/phosphonate ABC transporter substrate-binding protein [Fischerella]MBD2434157.1 phosphate/phosphite/phosphonate ABC transporter substrate-binding protein [Fischerella sp. FACHB-380]PLZ93961.1 phosphate/phosphite/phosphonate ABC transporter substrate-binding protein [Fischerella muscicola CCMEE 5323]
MRLIKKGVLGASLASVALVGIVASTLGEKSVIANLIPNQKEQTLLAQGKTKELVVVFPSRSDSTDLQNKANAVAAFLSKQLGVPVKAQIGDDTAAVEALRANRADIAFLSSRPALKAEQLANARLYLAEVRPTYSGKYTYNSVFVVPKNSPLKTQSTAKATLSQLRGKRMAFTSPTSGSGFIFPTGELVKQGLVQNRDRLNNFFGQVAYGGNYSKAIQAVLRGQADVAAVSEYALNPPYITEAEKNQLRILHKVSGVPAHGVAIDDDVPAATREKIINAMLLLNQPQNNQLLRNLYNSTELVKVNHNQHLAPLRNALQLAGIQP